MRINTTTHTTDNLLLAGVLAGPLNLLVVLTQAFTRDGFDPTKHAGSMLTLGNHGWIQTANFIVTGILVILGAIGLRQVIGKKAASLLAVFGAGTALAGVFLPDPALGFPLGTPEGQPVTMSWHGTAHFAVGGIGFLAFIACCVVVGNYFRRTNAPRWATASYLTGALFLAAFAGIASGSAGETITLGFWAAIALAWIWLTATLNRFRVSAR
ncbi:hypothetical protein BWI15_21575 [Kribbella sp. ALI-6-A]|uniref:DUF998 domain-containing protein n=1 Tax=Kribbella sp. ALI-6-A TaxID=1933817 RepID=UPI00097BF4FE|nr:DUF998 domain-containing protein [Kribbella sp. ALI-6-A]ONI69210.1 hypothetical protein BWI15_21575 [Kribbella sp. ALI-6-A]